MSVREIGMKLVQLCKEDKNLEAVRTLYADDVVSIEAGESGGPFARVTRGKPAVLDKNVLWGELHDIHRAEAIGPYPHGDDRFAVRFSYDATVKATGQRFQMDEVAVFTVAGGKIVKEEFFYDMGG